MDATPASRWPSIPLAGWQYTRDTLHLYTQVIGKVRLTNEAAERGYFVPVAMTMGWSTGMRPFTT